MEEYLNKFSLFIIILLFFKDPDSLMYNLLHSNPKCIIYLANDNNLPNFPVFCYLWLG